MSPPSSQSHHLSNRMPSSNASSAPPAPYAKFQSRLKKSLDGHLNEAGVTPYQQQQQRAFMNVFEGNNAPNAPPLPQNNAPYPFFQHPALNLAHVQQKQQQSVHRKQIFRKTPTTATMRSLALQQSVVSQREDSDSDSDDELTDIESQKKKPRDVVALRDETVDGDVLKTKGVPPASAAPIGSLPQSSIQASKIPETREEKLAKLRGRSFFRSSFRSSPLNQYQQFSVPLTTKNPDLPYSTPFQFQQRANMQMNQQQQAAAFMFQSYMQQMMSGSANNGMGGGIAPPGMMPHHSSGAPPSPFPTPEQHQEMMRQVSQQIPPPFGMPPSPNPMHTAPTPKATSKTPAAKTQDISTAPATTPLPSPPTPAPHFSTVQQDEIHKMVQQGHSAMKRAWNHLLNTKKSVLIRIEELSEYLFRNTEPTSLEATLRLLDESKSFFKQVSRGEFECHSVREVERIEKEQEERINEEFQRCLTLAKVAFVLCERTKSPSRLASKTRYQSVLDTHVKRLKELKPNGGKEKDATKHYVQLVRKQTGFTPEDHQVLRDLKHYALGISTGSTLANDTPQSGIQKIHQLIMEPLGISLDTSSAFELCRQLNLFESDNIPLLRALHLQPDQFKLQFPKKVLDEARAIKNQMLTLPDPDAKVRRDLRSLPAFAIDDEGTLEVDDAISVRDLKDGRIELYIHIADATKYINPKDEMNQTALERVSSVYLPDKHIPMLPCDLSIDVMSLSDKRDNDVLTFIATINAEGTVEDCQVVPSKISRVHRWTYDHFDTELSRVSTDDDQLKMDPQSLGQIRTLLQAANLRLKHRLMKGAQNVAQKGASEMSSTVSIDTKSNAILLKPKIHTRHSRRIVEEFMIVANEVSAKFAAQNNITIPFRGTHGTQNEPVTRTEEEINEIINTKSIFTADDLVARMKETGFRVDLEQSKRSTGAAMFSKPRPHHALGVSAYTYATSPLRRYIDLLVHHQLKCWFRGSEPLTWDEIQSQLNRVEPKQRQIYSLQKESSQYWTLKYFERRQGDDFDGVICGIDSVLSDSLSDRAMLVDVLLPGQGYHTKMRVQRDVEVGEKIKVRCVHCKASTSSVRFIEV